MFNATLIVILAIAYIGLLFLIAWAGDAWMRNRDTKAGRPLIYALSIAVYCSTWTFFGSVGRASSNGWDFLAVYIGPMLVFLFGWPLILRIVRLSKSQNITSVSDFLAARYGKSPTVAGIVTAVAFVGLLPYLALQLKAVVLSTEALLGGNPLVSVELPSVGIIETAFVTTVAMAIFAVLFGTRHIDATEHQDGLIVAIAAESLVKLFAFLTVGIFVVFYAFGDFSGFITAATGNAEIVERFGSPWSGGAWLVVGLLSTLCILLLPRQFHVTVVENRTEHEVRRASWLLPLYLLLINLFVVPIAIAGMLLIRPEIATPDMFVLAVPLDMGADFVTLFAYVGGLSAATAMVVVESIALAIMVCNGVVVPMILHTRGLQSDNIENISDLLLTVRRVAICVILLLCYGVYLALADVEGLAAIGLISFAAIAQLAPAFFGGLYWREATAKGAIAGIVSGTAVWAYTLVLPWVIKAGFLSQSILTDGPFGLAVLRPQALLFIEADPLSHGVFWSLLVNVAVYVVVSRWRVPAPIERLQAHVFVQSAMPPIAQQPTFRFWRTSVTVGDLQSTAARYLGPERTERSFAEFQASRNAPHQPDAEADFHLMRFTEHLLTSAIGAASARLVLTLLLRRSNVTNQSALRLLDDASEALQYHRDILQSALDEVRHGLCVFNKDNELVCWNRQFRELLDLPPELRNIGVPLDQFLRFLAERGDFGKGDIDTLVAKRLTQLSVTQETFQERIINGHRIVEVRTAAMPQGGFVTTYSDITERVAAADALAKSNQTLEQRVRERTAELVAVNTELGASKAAADEANRDKTRFLAAASHDILQPLNAARLYATALTERELPAEVAHIASRIDTSLTSVEDILGTLVEISRMDSGRLEPEIKAVSLEELFDGIRVEFEPAARERGLVFDVVPSTLWVRTDRKLTSRMLQNLVANAIKYTPNGRVLVGARRRGEKVRIEVLDTGVGIPSDKQELVFQEFQRLETRTTETRGLGLGLSIVQRIGRTLDQPVHVRSKVGVGSRFSVEIPIARRPRVVTREAKPVAYRQQLNSAVVVCIDNEPAILDGMRTMLQSWGCHVIAATDADGALQQIAEQEIEPTILLADYHLDDGNGIDAILKIRQTLEREIEAVIITADHSPEVQRLLRSLQVTLMRKPLKAAALRALLSRTVSTIAAE